MGMQAHSQNFWFGENLGNPSQNPWKSGQTPWKYGPKWRPKYFDLKKTAPRSSQKWSSWKNIRVFAQKVAQKYFSDSSGKNRSHPQKFACCYTYNLDDTRCGFRRQLQHREQISTLHQFSRYPGSMPKTCMHLFCRRRESIWPGSSWKTLGGVVGGRCRRVPLAGRQVTVFLLRRLCSCRRR